jgi:DNA polymerase-3 subunit gamma/tau
MSLALYRTYRPGRLSEVVGQEHVTQPLARALANDRVHHAYLLSGPRGCGKTSTARILARSLNCEQGPTPEPCGTCISCVELAPNGPGSLDVIELDAASHGGVDDTRDLRERAMFAPVSSRYKVYIIDEAHMVTTAGFNALLKLVEEPPEHVRFIFATTEADKVLPTIRSRTHHYTFRLVPTKTLQAHLENVCAAEGITADPDALALVARMGAGSVRDALSVLGQLVAGSIDGITYPDAVAQLGVTDLALVDAAMAALADCDGAALLGTVDAVISAGHDPRRFATDLLQRLRDLIVILAMSWEQAQPLLDAPEAEIEQMREQATRFNLPQLSAAADLVSSALSDLRGATAPRLQLELLAARLLLPSLSAAPPNKPQPAPTPPAPKAPPRPIETPAPPKLSSVAPSTAPAPAKTEPAKTEPATVASGAVTLADVVTMWPAILEALKAERRIAWMAFSDAQPLSVDGAVLAVGVADIGKLNNIRSARHDELMQRAVQTTMHATVSVDVVPIGTGGGGGSKADPTSPGVPAVEADTPSLTDDDAEDASLVGESLAIAELGATVIGEIEQG